MIVGLAVGLAACYLVLPPRPGRSWTVAAWLAGCAVLAVALSPIVDEPAHRSFTAHMIQHLLLIFVVAPLLALGRPVARWLPPGPGPYRPARTGAYVVAATVGLVGVVYLTHLPPFYDAALTDTRLHALEHGAYLVVGLAFWMTVLQLDPLPGRAGYGHRIAALLVVMPCLGLLAAGIGSASEILYPAQDSTLADQQAGAALMWLGPVIVVLPAALMLIGRWARAEERREERIPLAARARLEHDRPLGTARSSPPER